MTRARSKHRCQILRYVFAAALCGACASAGVAQPSIQQLRAEFASPPADARPMVRWWWFGPAVVKPEIARELDVMHAAGIGGVELAAEYPLALDDPAKGILNLRYGSPEYVDDLKFANEHARGLGMRVDLTLGSGWPYGGPNIPIDLASGKLRAAEVALPGNGSELPKLAAGESFIAAFVANGRVGEFDAKSARRVPGDAMPAELARAEGAGQQVELFFISSHTRQQVKRAAFGGEGYVLDHMSRQAIKHYQQTTGDDLLGGFSGQPPYSIFSDSLEVYGADWTKGLPAEFARRRGYDLIPHLPELVQGGTPEAESVRRDWGLTLSELVRDNYLRPMAEYATAHATKFRSQTYGQPPVTLSDEHIAQLPEGEGPQWHAFSFTRWASSANHVYGNRITSAETFTWLHSPAWRATPLDMKAEADCMFLEGVNQIIGHGFPYSAPGVAEPGWSLYAAAALNDHNPWWPVMHDVTAYIQRISWAMRQGEPANDVALLLPEDDAQAAFRPGHASVTDEMHTRISSDLMGAILNTGYNVDYVDLAAAEDRGLHYPIVVVPPTERMPLSGVRILQAYVAGGGKLVFLGQTPSRAGGLADAGDTPAVASGVRELLQKAIHVETTGELASALPRLLKPDMELGAAGGNVGFLHRHLSDADIYFFANTTAEPVSFPVRVRSGYREAEWWDTDGGRAERAELGEPVTLPAYGSRLLVLSNGAGGSGAPAMTRFVPDSGSAIKLADWSVTFPGSRGSAAQPTLQNVSDTLWTDNAATKFYSGEARYTTQFHVDSLKTGEHVRLQFASGEPVRDNRPPGSPGMRAWLDPPIHEAAEVFVNGNHVGDLWHPPYEIDVTSATHSGENTLELRVFNTAINELAGQPPRDYTSLKAKYGDRFQMQDMNNLQPVPSGIRGPVQIVFGTETPESSRRMESR
ncbi:MAG TPA: glycosyl hydrolase [Acidobacteriaceae bacterium]|nr:glycosyl hydrolase [Acidobacteriaceae bacterium]